MTVGTYTSFGLDTNEFDGNHDGNVDVATTGGTLSIAKISDGGGANTDADVLDIGDTFQVSGNPSANGTYTFQGSANADDIIGVDASGDQIWLSDTNIFVGNAIPTPNSSNVTVCFAAGTLIATPDGEVAVDTLTAGQSVLTADGRAIAVKWIGHQTVSRRFTPVERFRPVRVLAGALAENVPHSDLVLTAQHALIFDNIAVNAGALVNGTTIHRVPADKLPDRVTYFHIETDDHSIVLANGAQAETFVDNVSRRVFDNYAEYKERFGPDTATMSEMPHPRAISARQVPISIRNSVALRAAMIDRLHEAG